MYDDEQFKMKRLFDEFQKMDEFFDAFKLEFDQAVMEIIKKTYPDYVRTDVFNEMLSQYAHASISVAYAIVDKDRYYPEFRIKDEEAAVQRYFAKAVELPKNKDIAEAIHQKAKELVVKNNPQIIDLSGEGFRLMEMNMKIFNLEFMATFNKEI